MDRLLNHIKIKEFVHKHKFKIGKRVIQTLEKSVKELLLQAMQRTKENSRTTLLWKDV